VATTSTLALMDAVRDRIRDYVPPGGTALGTALGGRLWWGDPPDNATYPHATMELTGPSSSGGHPIEVAAFLEIIFRVRGRANWTSLRTWADTAVRAMTIYHEAGGTGGTDDGSGWWQVRGHAVAPIPAPADAAYRDLGQVRVTFDLVAWPQYLTALHDTYDASASAFSSGFSGGFF
jgi:hypothetical protein